MKKVASLAVVLILLVFVGQVSAAEYTGRKVEAKFASEEIEGDFMTVWGNHFADAMKKWSDGKINIIVYPYGTLGDTRDINELCQIGVVDFVYSDFAWISSFVPQAQALALHYIWPREKIAEVLEWVVKNGEFMKLLEEKFRHNGLVPLGIAYEGWQWITSKRPIHSVSDMEGLKVRLMSSKLLVENYKAYGASPTPMSYGEVYSGLQMGLIDAQVNPMFADYSMKFYEVQDYFTQIWAEPFLGIPTVNMVFFNSLPKNAQKKMRRFWADAIVRAGKWIDERNAHDMEKIKKERPEVKFTEMSDEQIKGFKEKAKTVYPKFVEIGGEDAGKVLETLLNDVKKAKAALGVK
jgi:TRAP-type C4-dicarboxylate transport system substrate-binding protein